MRRNSANNINQGQKPQNAASDQGLYCLVFTDISEEENYSRT